MKFSSFLIEKSLYIILILLSLIMVEILLIIYDVNTYIKICIIALPMIALVISLVSEYIVKNSFYKRLLANLNELDDKYLISEIINDPVFIEGKILKETMQDAGKSMTENVNLYKFLQEEYKEYIELWIHEIKIPITTSEMIIENNKSEVGKNIKEELYKIENYTEQALFYARSNTVEKDYIISKVKLNEIVNQVILKNKVSLISNKINVLLHDLDKTVYTDSKWIVFILNQIIQNSIKYMKKDNKMIEIYSKDGKENTVLYIKDNGIGIKKEEINKVFEKGFTGENGRIIGKKSTGIGLYLCKKLCDKLGIKIELDSIKDKETIVEIVFPKNSFTDFE